LQSLVMRNDSYSLSKNVLASGALEGEIGFRVIGNVKIGPFKKRGAVVFGAENGALVIFNHQGKELAHDNLRIVLGI
jgi:hypothetical protein